MVIGGMNWSVSKDCIAELLFNGGYNIGVFNMITLCKRFVAFVCLFLPVFCLADADLQIISFEKLPSGSDKLTYRVMGWDTSSNIPNPCYKAEASCIRGRTPLFTCGVYIHNVGLN